MCRIYSRNSRTFLTKILYLNSGCVIYARKRIYINKSGYTGNFLNVVLKAWITRVNTVFFTGIHRLLVTSKGRSLFPRANHFQGQLQTPQSLYLLLVIPWSIHSTYFPIHHPLSSNHTMLHCIQPLTAFSNKQHINKCEYKLVYRIEQRR
jgi:hypothetical protein